jgi:D-aminoacyl-tRNA deacylase
VIGLVVSSADTASVAISDQLHELVTWESHCDAAGDKYEQYDIFEMRTVDEWHLEIEDASELFSTSPQVIAFLSRHSGDTGPLLTTHFTGNFGPAEYGGEPGSFAQACPMIQQTLLEAFDQYAPSQYDVGIECTHHGPTTVGAPSLFVELGSSETEWNDPAGAHAVAQAILTLSNEQDLTDIDPNRTVIGFGGGHYAPRFERIIRETDWVVGHIGADWALDSMGAPAANRDSINRAVTASDADVALVADNRPELTEIIRESGIRVVEETWLRETTGVSRAMVNALEDALVPISSGLRLGTPATEYDPATSDEFTITEIRIDDDTDEMAQLQDAFNTGTDDTVSAERMESKNNTDDQNVTAWIDSDIDAAVLSFPTSLIETTAGIDVETTSEIFSEHTLAFETTEGGTRPTGRMIVADPLSVESMIHALMDILESKYNQVERIDGMLRVTHQAFDPEKATTLDVPEGPAFGRLAAGESVTIAGRTIDPEAVHTTETETFPIFSIPS